MIVRKAFPTDAAAIARVHVDSWRTTYKGILPDSYLDALSYSDREDLWKRNMNSQQVYLAETGAGEIVGFSVGGKERSGKYPNYDGELYAIYLLKEYQGRGAGRKLMEAVVTNLKALGCNSMVVLVLEDNPAVDFYQGMGGKKIDSIDLQMAGTRLIESVYGWEDLHAAFPQSQ